MFQRLNSKTTEDQKGQRFVVPGQDELKTHEDA